MEIISFYYLNIIVGSLLSIVLSLYGAHIVSRNKTVEILLVGQSIQTGILLGVILINAVFAIHQDHGVHPEMLVSLVFTMIVYFFYQKLTHLKKYAKTPVLVLIFTLLIALSYLIVAMSPLIESHMVKSYLGDIVTASQNELYFILIFSVFSLSFYFLNKKDIELQSFDLALFGHLATSKGHRKYLFFNIIVLCLMISSIHVLGIVFTLCMMIFPITLVQFFSFKAGQFFNFVIFTSPASVLVGFIFNILQDQFPTSALVAISSIVFGLIYLVMHKVVIGLFHR